MFGVEKLECPRLFRIKWIEIQRLKFMDIDSKIIQINDIFYETGHKKNKLDWFYRSRAM